MSVTALKYVVVCAQPRPSLCVHNNFCRSAHFRDLYPSKHAMAPTRLSIITTVVFIRLLIALATCTFFQPDEFFQSLEVAHHAVFGYGHVTWEWVSKAPIRSPIYPALYIPEYALLKLLWLDETSLLVGECYDKCYPMFLLIEFS